MTMAAPTREPVIHPGIARLLCVHLRNRGVDIADVLAGTGLTWTQLARESGLIGFGRVRKLILAAKRLSGCPSLGLEFGAEVDISAHGWQGFLAATSRDIGQALEVVSRYQHLRDRAVTFELMSDGGYQALVIHEQLDFGDVRTFVLECVLATTERMLRTLAGKPMKGAEYLLPYPPPTWANEYARCLAGTSHFGAHRMELRLTTELLRLPTMTAEPDLHARITLAADRELAQRKGCGDLAQRVRRRLVRQQAPYPTAQAMASEFHMSVRTMLRKLKHENMSYQALLDEPRKERAEFFLLCTHDSVKEISGRLGYLDTSNFSRTFRRWFGMSPSAFRQAHRT